MPQHHVLYACFMNGRACLARQLGCAVGKEEARKRARGREREREGERERKGEKEVIDGQRRSLMPFQFRRCGLSMQFRADRCGSVSRAGLVRPYCLVCGVAFDAEMHVKCH